MLNTFLSFVEFTDRPPARIMDSVCADTSLTQQPAEIEVMDQEAAPAIQVRNFK